MSVWIKRVLALLAVKKVIAQVQEMREPQEPSAGERLGKLLLWGAVVGGVVFAWRSGKLDGIIQQVTGGESGIDTQGHVGSPVT